MRHPSRRTVLRLAAVLQFVGFRSGLGFVQLRTLQLEHLWIRAEALGVANSQSDCSASANGDPATDTDTKTDPEAVVTI